MKGFFAVMWTNVSSGPIAFDLLSPEHYRELQLEEQAGIIKILEVREVGKRLNKKTIRKG